MWGKFSPTFCFFRDCISRAHAGNPLIPQRPGLPGISVDPQKLEQDMADRLSALGFELVELRRGGSARRPHLSVRIDWASHEPGRRVTVDDCATASRALEAWLDGAGYAAGHYILEVSSPGLDRPLRRLEEWRRFAGRRVEVLVPSLGGRFTVTATGVEEGAEPAVGLEFPKGERRVVRLADIKEARLAIDF